MLNLYIATHVVGADLQVGALGEDFPLQLLLIIESRQLGGLADGSLVRPQVEVIPHGEQEVRHFGGGGLVPRDLVGEEMERRRVSQGGVDRGRAEGSLSHALINVCQRVA